VPVDQDQAMLLGVSSQVLAQTLSAEASGINVTLAAQCIRDACASPPFTTMPKQSTRTGQTFRQSRGADGIKLER